MSSIDQTETQVSDQESVVVVNTDFTLFSGRKKLRPKDLQKVAPSDLPPEDVATLGHKKVVDPKDLAPLYRLRREVERNLLEVGFRFMGQIAVPESEVKRMDSYLKDAKKRFYAEVDDFRSNLNRRVDEWCNQHPEWAPIIRAAVPSPSEVTLDFHYRLVRVRPVTENVDPDADDSEDNLLEGACETIFSEIAQHASQTWETSYKGAGRVSQKALRPLRRMRDKLNGLTFVDVRIGPVVETIDDALAECPKTGYIDGANLGDLQGVLLLLSDSDRMVAHGEAALGLQQSVIPPEVEDDEAATDDHESSDDADEHEEDVAEESAPSREIPELFF